MIEITDQLAEALYQVLKRAPASKATAQLALGLGSLINVATRYRLRAKQANKNDRQQQRAALVKCQHLAVQLCEAMHGAREHMNDILPDYLLENAQTLLQQTTATISAWDDACSAYEQPERKRRLRLLEVE